MSGFAYDSSPVDDDNRTPDMPLDAGEAKINQNRGPLAEFSQYPFHAQSRKVRKI